MQMTRRAEWMAVLAAFVCCNLLYAATQDVDHSNAAFGDGGPAYHEMAARALRGHPLQEAAPFVHRPAMPLLAAALADQLDWVIRTGFTRLSLGFNLLSVVLLALLLQRHVPAAWARLAVLVAFMLEPHSPVRLAYYHPVGVDSAALAFVLAGLVGADWFQWRPTVGRAAVLAVITAIGATFHEITMLPALCLLVTRRPGQVGAGTWRDRWTFLDESGAWLPLLSGLAVSLVIRAAVTAVPTESPGVFAQWPSMTKYIVAWPLVFGPWLVLPLLCAPRTARFLRDRPVVLLHGLLLALGGLFAAGAPERWFVFASPSVWLAVAFALSRLAFTSRWLIVALVVVQALWLRLGVPLAAPSYPNLWSHTASGSMLAVYSAVFLSWAAAAYGFVNWRGDLDTTAPEAADEAGAIAPARPGEQVRRLVARVPVGLLVAAGTVAAMFPVLWLATRRFYWTDFAHPGPGYIAYNLARIWTLAVLALAFWATGSRILQGRARPLSDVEFRAGRWIESAICGAAAWSIATVLLAVLDIYYVWPVAALLAVSVSIAIADLASASRAQANGGSEPPRNRGWGLVAAGLKFLVVFNAAALLLTIALWGNPGPDNDVPGNYLPYYEAVMEAHSNAPNGYWVHYFVSKGHGLALLVNVLSDVQGAALATFLLIVLGGAMVWRIGQGGGLIGLAGLGLYLQFYAEQGAYAKGHTIRNTLIVFLILSFVRFLVSGARETAPHAWSRIVVSTAIVLLSPLAAVLLVPLFCLESILVGVVIDLPAAKRYVGHAAWVLAITAGACLYNFAEVGLLELHSMPSFAGQWVDVERLSRWMDPNLAFVDERMAFIQRSLSGAVAAASVGIAPTQSLAESLRALLNQPSLVLLGGTTLIAVAALAWAPRPARGPSQAPISRAPMLAVVYLLAILLWIAGMRMFGGGPGSSMGRFTDFATPLGIALSVLVMGVVWGRTSAGGPRRILAAAMGGVFATALALGSSPVLAQSWGPSVDFLLGKTSYAAMFDANWQTEAASRLAAELPPHERVELVNFLPGFTAIPASPFQRPDGNVYLKDYTRVIYGTADEATELYAAVGINHFLFDVSGRSPLVWSGFGPLFDPESIRTRMRVVRHVVSGEGDYYLLTWAHGATTAELMEGFLAKWRVLLASERRAGTYRPQYVNGAAALGVK